MTTTEILEKIREVVSQHVGDELDLLEELCSEAEGWEMRARELEDERDAADAADRFDEESGD